MTVQKELLTSGLGELGLGGKPEQIEQLIQYASLIAKWNKTYNLTAIRSAEEVITHHLLDSAAVLPLLDVHASAEEFRVLDVGSGAGLPGLVWAILRPSWQVTTLDTVQKKCIFMQQAIGSLGLQAQAVHSRIEAFKPAQSFDVITSRAFSTLSQFVGLSQHCLHQEGIFAALKGKKEVDDEVPEGWKLHSISRIEVPFLAEERHLFLIQR